MAGFFKAYDMRGTFGVNFDLPLVYRIGRHLPAILAEANGVPYNPRAMRILVGHDARVTGPSMQTALVAGLREAGVSIVDLGFCTTPMTYFFTAEDSFDGAVMITASHNPPGDNGLKVSRRGALPVGYDSGLAHLEQLAIADASPYFQPPQPPNARASLAANDVYLARYLDWLENQSSDISNLRFAVDCSNGSAVLFARALFPQAMLLNDRPDGTFPSHSPNPLLAEARESLAQCVRRAKLDCGLIFDGDADRCVFVDEKGDFIQSDFLIPTLAQVCRDEARDASPTVIYDVRTSRAVQEMLTARGFRGVMGPVGHAKMKPLLRAEGAVCGGELAGHYYFRDFHGCDSGAYASLRLLGAFAMAKRAHAASVGNLVRAFSLAHFLAPVRSRYANSGERNYRVADKAAAMQRLEAFVCGHSDLFGVLRARLTLDGIRLELDAGWISVRASNTEPYLRLLCECDTPARLREWVAFLEKCLID